METWKLSFSVFDSVLSSERIILNADESLTQAWLNTGKNNSCANFIAQKLITDCLSEANILRNAVSVTGRGGATHLSKLYRYVLPHRVGFLRRFGLKTGIGIHTLVAFWSGIGYGFRGNYGSVWTYLLIQYQMSKKEREMCQFEMDLKHFFVGALI